jgi:hypothetical protein
MTAVTGRHPGDPSSHSLAAFLLARLTEDEIIAVDAIENFDEAQLRVTDEVGTHIVRHDPPRVLRDVAAKRAVVQMWLDGIRGQLSQNAPDGLDLVDSAMSLFAAVYSDHPDFRPAWLPAQAPEPRDETSAPSDPGGDAHRSDNVVELRDSRLRRR